MRIKGAKEKRTGRGLEVGLGVSTRLEKDTAEEN
jgi:hypothetical protein